MSIAKIIALIITTISLLFCLVGYFLSVDTNYKKYKKLVKYIRMTMGLIKTS